MGFGDLTALGGERQMLLRREVLPRKKDDLVLDEGPKDVGHAALGQGLAKVDPPNFGTGGTGQWGDSQLDALGNGRHGDVLLKRDLENLY